MSTIVVIHFIGSMSTIVGSMSTIVGSMSTIVVTVAYRGGGQGGGDHGPRALETLGTPLYSSNTLHRK